MAQATPTDREASSPIDRSPDVTAEAEALIRRLVREYPRRGRRVAPDSAEVLADPERLRAVRDANLRRLFADGGLLDELLVQMWEQARDHGLVGALGWLHALLDDGRAAPVVLMLRTLDIFVVHHPLAIAAGLRVPPLHEHNRFVRGNDVVTPKPGHPTTSRFQPDVVETSWFQPPEPVEASLAYWREDYHRNAAHAKWHVVYCHTGIPDTEHPRTAERRFVIDRQGELFLHMHQQMMARYEAERLAWGLPPVAPFSDYREVLQEGYEPPAGLLSANEMWPFPFIARPAGVGLVHALEGYDGVDTMVPHLERIEAAIVEAIDTGRIPGTDVRLTEHLLGTILEPNFYSRRHFSGLFGVEGLHNGLHDNFSIVGQPAHTTNFGVLGLGQESSRDPVFYRIHRHFDDLRRRFADAQPPHDLSQHAPRGVVVTDFAIQSEPGDGVLETVLGKSRHLYERGKLQHLPFSWRIALRSAEGSDVRRVTARIFLCPAEFRDDRAAWIEMDKFSIALTPGVDVTVTRADVESSVAQREPDEGEGVGERWCDCGWPQNLLVPCGRPGGMRFVAFVLLTTDDLATKRCSKCTRTAVADEIVACGSLLQGGKYPDALGMGYPFNRTLVTSGPLSETLAALPNGRLIDVEVRLTHDNAAPVLHDADAVLRGYHFHAYFTADTKPQLEALLRALMYSPMASAVKSIGKLHERPVGPHPRPSVQLEVTREGAERLLPWFAMNRGDLTIFIHLDTGDELWDHTQGAIWLGDSIPLVNLECLENPRGRPLP